jgi:hypothetical protein
MSLIHARSTTATKADSSPAVEELNSTSKALNVFLSGSSIANTEGTALASAVRTATTNSSDIIAYNAKGILCFFNVTAVTGGQTVTAKIQFKDPASGSYFDAPGGPASTGLNPATDAVGAIATRFFQVGAINSGFSSSNVSSTWRVVVTHSGGGNFTYSVGYSSTQ